MWRIIFHPVNEVISADSAIDLSPTTIAQSAWCVYIALNVINVYTCITTGKNSFCNPIISFQRPKPYCQVSRIESLYNLSTVHCSRVNLRHWVCACSVSKLPHLESILWQTVTILCAVRVCMNIRRQKANNPNVATSSTYVWSGWAKKTIFNGRRIALFSFK